MTMRSLARIRTKWSTSHESIPTSLLVPHLERDRSSQERTALCGPGGFRLDARCIDSSEYAQYLHSAMR